MKIVCNSRDEILRKAEEFDKSYNKQKAQYDKEYKEYAQARQVAIQSVLDELLAGLRKFTALDFDIDVYESYVSKDGKFGIDVTVKCNEHQMFDENVALAWYYRASVSSTGDLQKETSSWSGLKATTPDQIESLKQTLAAIEYLNGLDWNRIVHTELPRMDSYVKTEDPKYSMQRPDFNSELLQLDVSDSIGTNQLFKGVNRKGAPCYYMFIKETDKQYKVVAVNEYMFARYTDSDILNYIDQAKKYPETIKKSELSKLVKYPVETIEL